MRSARTRKLTASALGVAFVAVCAWIALPLGPVPVSLQTLGVALIAGVLGPLWGTLSVLVYLAVGALGVPVFAAFGAGVSAFAGPTGGFLLALPLFALAVGFGARRRGTAFALSLVGAHLLLYAIGGAFYALLYAKDAAFLATLTALVLPFLAGDLCKGILAFFLTRRLTRAEPFLFSQRK